MRDARMPPCESRNFMPEMREASVGKLDPVQAAELSLLVDLEARWWADRVGARMNKARVSRSPPPGTIQAAIRDLEALGQWCDDLAGVVPAGWQPEPPRSLPAQQS